MTVEATTQSQSTGIDRDLVASASSFQENDPWPVFLERGAGARVWDVDGHEYVDVTAG